MAKAFVQLEKSAINLVKLKCLCISQIKLTKDCVQPLAGSIKGMHGLKSLDLSATNLNGHDIHELLSQIQRFNCLRSLDLSYNSAKQVGIFNKTAVDESSENNVIKTIANFIHFSDHLLHVDLGGLNFNQIELEYIVDRGLRKSRTLLSCHLVGANNFGDEQFQRLLDLLKVKKPSSFGPRLKKRELLQIFANLKEVQESKEFFADGLKKQLAK